MGRLLAVGLVVIAALVAVLVVNGEGPNKPEEKEADAPAATATQVTTTPEQAEGTENSPGDEPSDQSTAVGATVTMKKLRFMPSAVSVAVGQAVRFVNDDDVAHTILQDFGPRSGQTPAVDSERILPGDTFEFVVRTNGLISYVCTLHPSVMTGQVLSEKPAA